jgi:hypothetical protein
MEQAGSLKLESLLSVSRELGILLDGAIKQVSEEFHYLVDPQRFLPCLQRAVFRVRNIPEGFKAFGTLLLSVSIREVHAERVDDGDSVIFAQSANNDASHGSRALRGALFPHGGHHRTKRLMSGTV